MLRRTFSVWLLFAVGMVGCDSKTPVDDSDSDVASAPAAIAPSARTDNLSTAVMQKWSRSCALCHVTGNAGAPRVGNAEEWRERLEQGSGVMLTHTIEGLNDMPPLGYCMSCEREDFIAMIDFMAAGATGEAP